MMSNNREHYENHTFEQDEMIEFGQSILAEASADYDDAVDAISTCRDATKKTDKHRFCSMKEGPTLEQFLEQKNSKKDSRQQAFSQKLRKGSLVSMVETTGAVVGTSSGLSSVLSSKNQQEAKAAKDESTTDVFLQLCFSSGEKIHIKQRVGLKGATGMNQAVAMKETTIIVITPSVKATCSIKTGLDIPSSIRVCAATAAA